MPMNRYLTAGLVALGLLHAFSAMAASDEGAGPGKWEELEAQLPAFPKDGNLQSFYVSAATDNRFYIDPLSISVGDDGVVRYTLAVISSAGVKNISFEGMRCETGERRLYAFGRSDGNWSKSRSTQWVRVVEATANRHHSALFQEYFCPGGVIVRSPEEARSALLRGGHPSTSRW